MCEKTGGCSYIRCICGYSFCYDCTRPYVSCRYRHESNPLHGIQRDIPLDGIHGQESNFQSEFTSFTFRRAEARTSMEPERMEQLYERIFDDLKMARISVVA
jgi:hypothetical protein